MIDEKDLLEFFRDIEFMPPNNRDPREFIDQPETDVDTEEHFSFEDIETADHSDHPNPAVYSDYYMFTDPVARGGGLISPKSPIANTRNVAYSNKDLENTHSFSDIHHETLEQEVPDFPRHQRQDSPTAPSPNPDGQFPKRTGVRSMADPTVAFEMERPDPQDIILQHPTIIEGTVYPAGTRIRRRVQ